MSGQRERTFCWIFAILGALSVGVLALSFLYTPSEVAAGAFQRALGIDAPSCPGCALCGLSRAFSLASHGEWRDAMGLNILFLPAYGGVWAMALGTPFATRGLIQAATQGGDST